MGTSVFRSTLNQGLARKIYPAMFEITGVIPGPMFQSEGGLFAVEKMACLNWKSDAPAMVTRPLPKGNGISS